MDTKKEFEEKREHKRFRSRYRAVAELECQPCAKVGLITDISKNGLAFCYLKHEIEREEKQKEAYKLKVLLYDKGFYLDEVPCRVVSDKNVLTEYSFGLVPINRCAVQFDELTTDQISLLEYFIENYTDGSTYDSDDDKYV